MQTVGDIHCSFLLPLCLQVIRKGIQLPIFWVLFMTVVNFTQCLHSLKGRWQMQIVDEIHHSILSLLISVGTEADSGSLQGPITITVVAIVLRANIYCVKEFKVWSLANNVNFHSYFQKKRKLTYFLVRRLYFACKWSKLYFHTLVLNLI